MTQHGSREKKTRHIDDEGLRRAAELGQADTLRALLAKIDDPDRRDSEGMTALLYAVYKGHTECARLLIAKGADCNAADNDDLTALMQAAMVGNDDCVTLLLDHGASIDANPGDGVTALGMAVWNGLVDTSLLPIGRGADVNVKTEEDDPLLVHAAANDDNAQNEIALALIKKGAALDVAGPAGTTPLICAAWGGNAELVQALLAAGARTDLTTPPGAGGVYAGLTARGIAQNEKHFDIVKMIDDEEAARRPEKKRDAPGKRRARWSAGPGSG
jgi:ankyrin repeat protein